MPDEKDFVHLHVHTEFSLLDGLSQIKRLVKRSAEAGMNALAITDHGTMFGVIDFYRACQAQGIKPIIGMEAYLARRGLRDRDPEFDSKPYHLLLLAKNQTGYQNLLQLASIAQLEGYYYRPRVDHDTLAAFSEGLVATSGCLAAEIPRMVEDGREEEALRMIGWYRDIFGPENFFLELQEHDINELHALNRWLLANQDYANVPLVATNDVHYVLDDDYDAHDTLLCIQTGNVKAEQNRLKFTSRSFHLRTPDEMWRLFADVPEALRNTRRIEEMCNVSLDFEGYHLPVFPVPEGFTAESYLRLLCEEGLRWRFGARADDPDIQNRLYYELQVIHNMGFDTYFLIVWDLCEFARHADIWWNVRGSGAGSLAAYCLGITNIDPMLNGLLFERFLNPGRVSMPDIDLDYPEDRRAEMIQYCSQKYGEDKVAAIITFGTMGAKAAIRDVGRAFDMPLPEVDRIARLIPTLPGKPIRFDDALGDDPEKALPELKEVYENNEDARRLIDTARQLEGVTRHASTHAAGVIVADKPLVEYIPLHRPTKGSAEDAPVKMVTQFDMETCESIGLLKVDFLGLSTLTIMRRACELVAQYHGIHFDLSNIPYRPDPDDPDVTRKIEQTFAMIGRGDTVGVFQLESQGMRRMLTDMRPTKFEHIVAGLALYRPGPLEYIPMYNRRLHGDEVVEFRHPLLRPILEETYGICVSGDSLILDVKTGQRYRVDQIAEAANPIYVQGIDENYQPAVGRVTHLIHNGEKPVYCVTLKNGLSIKTTCDHRFLTETGWKPLNELNVGAYIATPPRLFGPEEPLPFDRDKLRILAYLIADGSLASGSSVDFVNKDQRLRGHLKRFTSPLNPLSVDGEGTGWPLDPPSPLAERGPGGEVFKWLLIDEYVRCLKTFDDLEPVYTEQIHDVTRVGIRNFPYRHKTTNGLLAWMRELGFKYPPGIRKHPRGVRSQEKSLPDFVFRLNDDDLAFFLASLWDCDGYMSNSICHYKTISSRLASDIQTLLLRFGIYSAIYSSSYDSSRGKRTAYQVSVYDTALLSQLLSPYMLTEKQTVLCDGVDHSITINRLRFIEEVKRTTDLSARQLMEQYGIDRQHFMRKARKNRVRISAYIVEPLANALPLPQTQTLIRTGWEEITSIEPAGIEPVYDLTVGGIHNFVANNIMVHNCVYQEQIMQIAGQLFGYELGEADLMRRAVSKKKKEDLLKHRQIFIERGPEHGVDAETAGAIFDDIEFFARYGFNKCLVGDTLIFDANTGRLVRIGDLANGTATIEHTLTCDLSALPTSPLNPLSVNGEGTGVALDSLSLLAERGSGGEVAKPCLKPGLVTQVISNGVKPVYRLTTPLGREITATANHPFYTPDGWRLLGELRPGDSIATLHPMLTGAGQAASRRPPSLNPSPHAERDRDNGRSEQRPYTPSLLAERGPGGEVGGDIYWDTVAAIEYAGEQEVFDLTVPGTHNFVANDIIVHNSHAADYAVLTCQTAYLKCHYPHEYMAALMSVHRDEPDKVGLFAADCARMNIEILPPTVNDSELDFSIQPHSKGRAIRFGLGAIKNLGIGAAEHILDQRRDGGRFRSLEDFCHRVDTRTVNKRALESLIKVGALDELAPRPMLLAALDRIISFSADYHKAKDAGQMSLFGDATGADFGTTDDILGPVRETEPVTRREMLNWEKELVGLYVTDHPLKPIMDQLQRITSHTSAELTEAGEALNGQIVTVAGLVTNIRSFPTKKGDMMAVLTIEDITGTIAAVLFPRTWGEYRDLIDEDAVIIVTGKADASRGDMQIIADSVRQNFETAESDYTPPALARDFSWLEESGGDEGADEESPLPTHAVDEDESRRGVLPSAPTEPERGPGSEVDKPPSSRIAAEEMPGWLEAEMEGNGWSPPPDWAYNDNTGHIIREEAPDDSRAFDDAGRVKPPPAPAARPRTADTDASPPRDVIRPRRGHATPDPAPEPPPGRMLTLYIQRTGDSEKDQRRIHRLHGKLIEYPGHDHFRFMLVGPNDKITRLNFPKHPIEINDEMLDWLREMLGEENVVIEES